MPVVSRAQRMGGAVELDHEARRFAVEVHDIAAYDLLAAEVKARDFASSQCEPQSLFRWRHPAAQRFG
jgi:hypothetical protein